MSRTRSVLLVAAVVIGAVGFAPATEQTQVVAACDGRAVDAATTTVPLCGELTIDGRGGDRIDLEVAEPTVVDLHACGATDTDSDLCDLDTFGTSPVIGLLLVPTVVEDDEYDFLLLAERSRGYGGGYREQVNQRGFSDDPGFVYEVVVPAGRWTLRVVGDDTPSRLVLRTGGEGALSVDAAPTGATPWTDLDIAYGTHAVAGLGANLTTTGASFVAMTMWFPHVDSLNVEAGRCVYSDHVPDEAASWSPGCSAGITTEASSREYQYPLLFGGPGGSAIGLVHAGGADRFAWGFWHASVATGGNHGGMVYQLDLG